MTISDAVLVAIIGLISGLIGSVLMRRKTSAEAKSIEDQITERVLKRTDEVNAKLMEEVQTLSEDNEAFKIRIDRLESDNRQLRQRVLTLEKEKKVLEDELNKRGAA